MSRIAMLLVAVAVAVVSCGIATAAEPKPIEEVHLIHLSHTDFGFTDMPSTAMALHARYIGDAVKFADATAAYPDAARFRWTCDSALMVARYLFESNEEEKMGFAEAIRRGQIEVTAMPDNIVGLYDGPEWDAAIRRLTSMWKNYNARVALQNDVNGFPWGVLPGLREHGIEAVWMECSADTSVPLASQPDAWWWEGPDGKRTLTWSGRHFGSGFDLFQPTQRPRGPVPSSSDVWFNPPSPGETWKTSRADLDAAEKVLRDRLAGLTHYKFPVIAFEVTNVWRRDNDPPTRQIADFVKEWNASSRKPRLVMSTPSRFLARLKETAGDRITTVRRGDWQDWWSDGMTSTPELLIANQQAKRILSDLPAAAKIAGVDSDTPLSGFNAGWLNVLLFDEHTWGSYNSIAQPYDSRAAGSFAEKSLYAYRSAERAEIARTAMFRKADDYCDFSRTHFIRVLNPGATARSGWISIPAAAIRFPANAVRDVKTGEMYPLEDVRQPERSTPDLEAAPYDRPNDVWAWTVKQRRFFLANMAAGGKRDFELVDARHMADGPPPPFGEWRGPPPDRGLGPFRGPPPPPDRGLKATWDEATGRITSLRTADGTELVDSAAAYGLGQVVVESLKDRGLRSALADRDQDILAKQFRDEPVKLIESRRDSSPYATTYTTSWEHPLVYRVQQRWDVLRSVPRIELTTTIWTKETIDPCSLYIAFPLSVPKADMVYDSIGHETIFGRDTMPGTCAETLCQNAGLIFRSPTTAVLLATPDTPLGCAGGPALRRRLIAPYTPPNSHYYVNVANNFWHTNFSILKAGKLVLHHWIEPAAPRTASLAMLSNELWAYPIRRSDDSAAKAQPSDPHDDAVHD